MGKGFVLSGILTVVPIIPSDSIFKYPGLICLWVVKWLLWLSVFLRTVYNDHINTVQNIILRRYSKHTVL